MTADVTPAQHASASITHALDQSMAAYAHDRVTGFRPELASALADLAGALAEWRPGGRRQAGEVLIAASSLLAANYVRAHAGTGVKPSAGFLAACDALGRLGEQYAHLEGRPCTGSLTASPRPCAGPRSPLACSSWPGVRGGPGASRGPCGGTRRRVTSRCRHTTACGCGEASRGRSRPSRAATRPAAGAARRLTTTRGSYDGGN